MKNSKLKQLLKEKGYTVQEFSELSGLSKRSLDIYMSGKRKFDKTQFWFALKVADTLDIDPHELLEEREKN